MPSRCKLLSLAAALALVLACPLLARAEDVTIVVPDDGGAVLYSHDAAPDAVLALDPATAPEAVSLLLSSSSAASMLQAAADDESEVEAAVAPVAAAAAAAALAEEEAAMAMTEEEAMVEATLSMLQAALGGDDETVSSASASSSSSSEFANAAAASASVAAAAVAGQPAPEAAAAADAPSPAPVVVPTAQLVCPPTCPAGTRCRQGGRGVCEPFTAFDCAGGKCAPAPSTPPTTPTPAPTTTPPVCKARCTDVAPTPNWSCAQQRSFGACEQGWMIEGNYCQITCGRCPLECYDCNSMCLDNAPDRNGCAAQAGWGKCGETWMAGCMRSCGKCPAKCYSKAASSDGVPSGGAEFVSFVSVSPSTHLPKKSASSAKTAPSPSPSFELGPVSAPFGAISEVAAGPQGAPEASLSSFPAAAAAPVVSSSSAAAAAATAEAEAASVDAAADDAAEVSAAIERMMASAEGTSAAEVAFEA